MNQMLAIDLTPFVIILSLVVIAIQSNTMSETAVNTKTESDISLWIDEKQVKQFFNGMTIARITLFYCFSYHFQ